MASTAAPGVEAAIVELLEASKAEALQTTTISADTEPNRSPAYLWIWKTETKRNWGPLGVDPPKLEEDLTLHCRVLVIGKTAKETADAIFEAAETALRADLKLKQTVQWHRIMNPVREQVLFDEKRGFQIAFTISAQARI